MARRPAVSLRPLPVFRACFLPCPIFPAVFWREERALCPEQTLAQTSWVGRQLRKVGSSTRIRPGLLTALWAAWVSPEPSSSALGDFSDQMSKHCRKVTKPGLLGGIKLNLDSSGHEGPWLQGKVADRQAFILFHLFTLHLQLALKEKPCPKSLGFEPYPNPHLDSGLL